MNWKNATHVVASSTAWSDHLAVVAEAVRFAIEPCVGEIYEMLLTIGTAEASRMPDGRLVTIDGVCEAMFRSGANAEITKTDAFCTFGTVLQETKICICEKATSGKLVMAKFPSMGIFGQT